MADSISKPAWRYTIRSIPNFGSLCAAKETPFWDPNFTPPCGQLAAPYLYVHKKSARNFKLCTEDEVLEPVSYPVSHWPCPGWASHAWEGRQFW